VAADLGTKEGVYELARSAEAVVILVNSLGIFEPKPFPEITDADWLHFFEVNVSSRRRMPYSGSPRCPQVRAAVQRRPRRTA
jgi:NAD(P)-dependent dehydrogenase (short-subunit alcohol dehydrogenase family)